VPDVIWIVIILLLVFWLAGVFVPFGGSLIHILLVLLVVALLFEFLYRRPRL
jgi:hypothetical protein